MMQIPDRLSCDSESFYYMPNLLHRIGEVKINSTVRHCVEYCISEQWAICYKDDEESLELETISPAIIEIELLA